MHEPRQLHIMCSCAHQLVAAFSRVLIAQGTCGAGQGHALLEEVKLLKRMARRSEDRDSLSRLVSQISGQSAMSNSNGAKVGPAHFCSIPGLQLGSRIWPPLAAECPVLYPGLPAHIWLVFTICWQLLMSALQWRPGHAIC